jgi:PEP-CTERM motif-containing protein
MKKLLLLVAALLLPLFARADTVLYNNLGPGNSYNCCIGWTIGIGFTQGDQFTASATANLSSIDIALAYASGPTNGDIVSLYTDAGGMPGTLLEQWTATNLPNFGTTSNSPIVLTSTNHPLLMAGNQYWLIASPIDQNSNNPWNWNDTGAVGNHYVNGSVSLNTQGAFAVFGTTGGSVPEPASMFLLGTGLIGGAASLRKRLKKS